MGYTIEAKKQQKKIKDSYLNLIPFYQDKMGNFEFTKKEAKENSKDILKWLGEFEKYVLLCQNNKYYLTDVIE